MSIRYETERFYEYVSNYLNIHILTYTLVQQIWMFKIQFNINNKKIVFADFSLSLDASNKRNLLRPHYS